MERRWLRGVSGVVLAVAGLGCGRSSFDGPASGAGGGGGSSAAASVQLQAPDCATQSGARPASSSAVTALSMGSAFSPTVAAGQPLSGQVAFTAPGGDAQAVLVQLAGAAVHYRCPLSPAELQAGAFPLSRLQVPGSSGQGSSLVYLGVQDRRGNVSGYTALTLSVGTVRPLQLCPAGDGTPAPALQLAGKTPAGPTEFFTRANGTLDEYRMGSDATGYPLTIVYRTQALVDLGRCTRLLVSGDATGATVPGWDNILLVEVRAAPGQAPLSQALYGSYDTTGLFYLPTGTWLAPALAPSVAGDQLDPPVPNWSAFGFQPRTIDLLRGVPAGLTVFELTVYILDFGQWGSTTEVWVQPE